LLQSAIWRSVAPWATLACINYWRAVDEPSSSARYIKRARAPLRARASSAHPTAAHLELLPRNIDVRLDVTLSLLSRCARARARPRDRHRSDSRGCCRGAADVARGDFFAELGGALAAVAGTRCSRVVKSLVKATASGDGVGSGRAHTPPPLPHTHTHTHTHTHIHMLHTRVKDDLAVHNDFTFASESAVPAGLPFFSVFFIAATTQQQTSLSVRFFFRVFITATTQQQTSLSVRFFFSLFYQSNNSTTDKLSALTVRPP